MSSCKKFAEKLSEYLDGYVANSDKIEIEKHLRECTQCSNEFQQMGDLKSSLSSLTKHKTPPHFKPALYSKLRSPKSQSFNVFSSVNLRLQVPIYVGAAAILLLTGVFLGQNNFMHTPFKTGKNITGNSARADEKPAQPAPELIPVTQNSPNAALEKSNEIVYF